MSDWRHFRTERLELRAASADDVDVLYALNSDPRVWTHLPSGVHTSRRQTAVQMAAFAAAWRRDGLGYWMARTHDGAFVGVGGCAVKEGFAWNLYYRFAPEAQGKGFASELVRVALEAARAVRSEIPTTAYLLEHNLASKAVAEKAGLKLLRRGPDAGNPDPAAIRLIYADRDLAPQILDRLVAHV